MNGVNLIGRVTRDIELRATAGGKSVTNFSLAVNRRGEGADFFNCVAWDKTAELMSKYVKKGDKIAVTGRLQVREHDRNGVKTHETEVIADSVEFLENKRQTAEPAKNDEFVPVEDDKLPWEE